MQSNERSSMNYYIQGLKNSPNTREVPYHECKEDRESYQKLL